MNKFDLQRYQVAASVMNEYIQMIAKNPGGNSWWTDHNGKTHMEGSDVKYFFEMWDDIRSVLGPIGEEE